jgi:hypothetical protein
MTSIDVDYQLASIRAIRTLKNHLIAGLCSTNKDIPLHLWDRFLGTRRKLK